MDPRGLSRCSVVANLAEGPLTGIRVLDFTQMWAGPFGTQMLALMGAEVIKVEKPGKGDLQRYLDAPGGIYIKGENPQFLSCNLNKKSITVNLKSEKGLEIIRRIAKTSDVVVQNFRPNVAERLGLGYENLKKLNSKLIYCSVSGYGSKGPLVERPGQDLLAQALTGMIWMNGRRNQTPMAIPNYVADTHTATLAALGILIALFKRERTGQGDLVEVNLLSSAVDLQAQELAAFMNSMKEPERGLMPIGHPYEIAPYGTYRTKDSYIALSVISFEDLDRVFGTNLARRFRNRLDGFKHRDRIMKILQSVLLTKKTQEWLAILEKRDLWCAPVLSYRDFVKNGPIMSQLRMNKMIVNLNHPVAGKIKLTGNPIKLARFPGKINHAPTLGQHTEQVLKGLGYSKREIEQFRQDSVL